MANKVSGVVLRIDRVAEMLKAVNVLTSNEVMVGVPDTNAGRRDGPITNASLAYIHDKGSPDARIPARPFMEPGVKAVQDRITTEFEQAGRLAFAGNINGVMGVFTRVGLIASQSIKAKISEGIPPPLAPSTIEGRINRVKSKTRRKKLRADLASGSAASRQGGTEGLWTPLIVTGQLRNAITYVLRRLKKGE